MSAVKTVTITDFGSYCDLPYEVDLEVSFVQEFPDSPVEIEGHRLTAFRGGELTLDLRRDRSGVMDEFLDAIGAGPASREFLADIHRCTVAPLVEKHHDAVCDMCARLHPAGEAEPEELDDVRNGA